MQRATNWQHPDGGAANVTALTLALTDHMSRLVEKNNAIYDSSDFKIGINIGQLSE